MRKGICVHCDREVESGIWEPEGIRYIVETRSGDDGGLYDFCTGDTSTNERHKLGVQE